MNLRKSFKRKTLAKFSLTRKYNRRELEKIFFQYKGEHLEAKTYDFYTLYTYNGPLRENRLHYSG